MVVKDEITKYIPQRAPLVMIDAIVTTGEVGSTTSFLIKADNIFCENGCLNESGLIENIAQTAAAHAGYQSCIKNLPVSIGYIAAIKNLRVYGLPQVGSTLNTSMEVTNQVFNVTIVRTETRVGNQLICECEMRVFIPDTAEKTMRNNTKFH